MTLATTMIERWTDPKARPLFRGMLIDGDGCCCAQGDVLRVCGVSDADLRSMDQKNADERVAAELGLGLAHAVLLRVVNDSAKGCPERVLRLDDDGIGKVLGSEWRRLLKFWRHLDRMTKRDWAAAWDAAGAAARDAAWAAARDAAWAAARAAAWDAAWAAGWASNEIQGHSKLKSLFFLPAFGFKTIADIDALPDDPAVAAYGVRP